MGSIPAGDMINAVIADNAADRALTSRRLSVVRESSRVIKRERVQLSLLSWLSVMRAAQDVKW